MRHRDEQGEAALVRRLAAEIAASVTRPWTLMEVCGGQTNAIVRYGLDQLLPEGVELIHGPGCPVCVTPLERIDAAIALAERPGVTLCTFADMLRVPGSRGDLAQARGRGAAVRLVTAPLEALELARAQPEREVVLFAVGFETTAPATALAVERARRDGVGNFSALVCHVLVPQALEAILASDECRVQGFLAAGHVCTVMGYEEYEPLARRHRVPIVVTGFEPADILEGVLLCVRQLEQGRAEVENQYARSVRREGNRAALDLVRRVFEVVPRRWRGLGPLPASGLGLRREYAAFDAERRFGPRAQAVAEEPEECRAGLVLQGRLRPTECPAFGRACTPDRPLGAPMVSAEGACAAYFRHRFAPLAAGVS